jgi:hypothetical protein
MRSAVALLCIAAVALAGEDAAPAPTPAERFATVVADLPAPSAERGFSVSGGVYTKGVRLGDFSFSAKPDLVGGEVWWRVEDQGRLEVGEKSRNEVGTAWLRADLSAVRGEGRQTKNGEKTTFRWKRKEGAFSVETSSGTPPAATEETVAGESGALATVAAVILFCRLAPEKAEEYAATLFDPKPDDGPHLRTFSLAVGGEGDFRGRKARLYVRKDEKRTVTIALAPKSRDFLGMTVVGADGVTVELRPEAAAADGFRPPARSPARAALLVALAYGTGDSRLYDELADWPAIAADLAKKRPDGKFTAAGVRRSVLARLAGYEGRQPRASVLAGLKMAESDLTVEKEGEDRATVSFPAMYQGLVLVVGRKDGIWRLVALPGT